VRKLDLSFFDRDTLQVARDLLGKRLVRVIDGRRLSGFIVEGEAYVGEADRASHAAHGRTPRTEIMYGPPGCAYIYFIYGMYWCLNIVTEEPGFPAAILIRALEPHEGLEIMRARRPGRADYELTNGPGKLCVALNIDQRLNGVDLTRSDELFLEEGKPVDSVLVATSARVGLNDRLGHAAVVPWRVYVDGNRFVSAQKTRNTAVKVRQDQS
jgi:DNA-3-methyladenine glycosylase